MNKLQRYNVTVAVVRVYCRATLVTGARSFACVGPMCVACVRVCMRARVYIYVCMLACACVFMCVPYFNKL